MSATESRTKRARFATPISTTVNNSTSVVLSPTEAARNATTNALVSLPAEIRDLGRGLLNEFLTLKMNIEREEDQIARLSKDEYTPKSVKLDFKFKVPDAVYKVKSGEFNKLSETMTYAIALMQHSVRDELLKARKLVKAVYEDELKKHFAKAAKDLAQVFALTDPRYGNDNDFKDMHTELLILAFEKENKVLLKHSGWNQTNEQLVVLYNLVQKISDPNTTVQITRSHIDELSYSLDCNDSIYCTFVSAMKGCFTDSWEAYLNAKAANARQKMIRAYVASATLEPVTDTVAMEVDNALESEDNKTLKEAIKFALQDQEKAFNKKIAAMEKKLEHKLVPKNSNTGATKPGALPKKKNGKTGKINQKRNNQPGGGKSTKTKNAHAQADGFGKGSSRKSSANQQKTNLQKKNKPNKQKHSRK